VTRDEYVRNVGWWLRDLRWSTRRDLLTELRAHLDELPADTDLSAELGPPEAYADDLRTAAGLERRRGVIALRRVNEPNPAENERPLERFHPFDLHPGETRWLVFKGVYACTTGMGGGGGGIIREALPVRFSFLWRTETTLVPLEDPLTIDFHKGCPPPRSR
jgi:hypothetical protein